MMINVCELSAMVSQAQLRRYADRNWRNVYETRHEMKKMKIIKNSLITVSRNDSESAGDLVN